MMDAQDAASPLTWAEYNAWAIALFAPFDGMFQRASMTLADTGVKVSYLVWGDPSRPLLICLGGVANVARRFDYLAAALRADFCVVCPDWVGRGHSGWLCPGNDYNFALYVEQTRQLMALWGGRPVTLLGSSMGATVAIELAAREPSRVARLILNDTGPFIDAATRTRRAATLAQDYIFRTPAELLRKIGASHKHDGPLPRSVRLHHVHALTRWSEPEGGRVYRHDLRAMQAYQAAAAESVDQWAQWDAIDCPVLVTRGMESGAFAPATLARMRAKPDLTVMHIPHTGHTPALADPNHIAWLGAWLGGAHPGEFSALYSRQGIAPTRQLTDHDAP